MEKILRPGFGFPGADHFNHCIYIRHLPDHPLASNTNLRRCPFCGIYSAISRRFFYEGSLPSLIPTSRLFVHFFGKYVGTIKTNGLLFVKSLVRQITEDCRFTFQQF